MDGLKEMDGLPSDALAMLRADGRSLLAGLGITEQMVEHSRAEAKRRVVENAKALAPRLFDDSRKPAKHLRLPAAWFGLKNPRPSCAHGKLRMKCKVCAPPARLLTVSLRSCANTALLTAWSGAVLQLPILPAQSTQGPLQGAPPLPTGAAAGARRARACADLYWNCAFGVGVRRLADLSAQSSKALLQGAPPP